MIITTTPEIADKDVTWTSSYTNIATVSSLGVVTGITVGQATIKATSIFNSDILATIDVVVNPIPVGDIISFAGRDWRVLASESNRVKILSVDIIETRPFHNISEPFYWASSEMRAYLNSTFLNRFNETDRARIVETTITNPNNQWYNTSGGANTEDRIFLLCIEEVVRYFGDSGQLAAGPQRYSNSLSDKYNFVRIANLLGTPTWWWLRSPGWDTFCAASVNPYGNLYVMGSNSWNSYGVRPALWLQL